MTTTQNLESFEQNPCLICSGSSFTWGSVGTLSFMPDSLSTWERLTRPSYKTMLQARLCNTCRNVQLFLVNPDKFEQLDKVELVKGIFGISRKSS
jgi:hypothetical protein